MIAKPVSGTIGSQDYPATLDLTDKQLPAIKDWQLGTTYKLVIEAELVNHGKGSFGDNPMRATFKVQSVKSAGVSPTDKATPNETVTPKETKLAALSSKAQTA